MLDICTDTRTHTHTRTHTLSFSKMLVGGTKRQQLLSLLVICACSTLIANSNHTYKRQLYGQYHYISMDRVLLVVVVCSCQRCVVLINMVVAIVVIVVRVHLAVHRQRVKVVHVPHAHIRSKATFRPKIANHRSNILSLTHTHTPTHTLHIFAFTLC